MKKIDITNIRLTKNMFFNNFLFIKKSIFTLLFTALLSVTYTAIFAQQGVVTITKQNVRLVEVLNEIESQTSYLFMYNNEVKTDVKVSIKVKKQPVSTLLNTLFKDKNIVYSFKGNHIVLTKKEEDGGQKTNDVKKQVKGISGVVSEISGQPIVGANIIEIGTTNQTKTDERGRFSLIVDAKSTIRVSFIGFLTKSVPISNGTSFIVTLIEDTKLLDEMVVVGYQKVNKKDVVGSLQTIKMDDIYMPNYNTIDKMLQGIAPGMIVTNSSSRAGTSPSIQIRGTSTLLGDASPLWVVDGIIQEDPIKINAVTTMSDDMKNIIGNQVSWLNPQDVETITILKDASATAIYGSKASNGVIVVTTKQAKGGDRITINYNASTTINSKPNYSDFNLMNSQERVKFSDEAFASGVPYYSVPFQDKYTYEGAKRLFIEGDLTGDQFAAKRSFFETANTDWFDLLTRNGLNQNHNLSFSGGSSKMSFTASLGYSNEQGQEIGNDSERYTGRIAVNFQLSPKLKLNLSITGGRVANLGFGNGVNPIGYATQTSRAIPAFDEFGNPAYYQKTSNYAFNKIQPSLSYNFINERDNSATNTESMRIASNADLNWTILPWLSYNFTGGYSHSSNTMSSYMSEQTYYIASAYRGYDYNSVLPGSDYFKAAQLPFGGEYFTNDAIQTSYNLQNKLAMNWTFNQKNRLNILVGQELRSGTNSSTANTVWGYSAERGEAIISPTLPNNLVPTAGVSFAYTGYGILDQLYSNKWKRLNQTNNFMSVFATASYSIANKYVFNASIRNDFSNRFGQDVNARLDPTYSIGASWNVAEEKFIKKNIPQISQFNLRTTYGIQGNALTNESPELSLIKQTLKPVFNQYFSIIGNIPNPNLSWERTSNWNFGADLLLFKKIGVVFDYYSRKSNAIFSQNIPYEFGVAATKMNGGIIYNRGLEGSLSFSAVNTINTGFSISINASKNWNKTGAIIGTTTLANYLGGRGGAILKEGYPVNAFWSYSFAGLNPTNGIPTFNLLNTDKDVAIADPSSFLVYSGANTPSVTGGLSMNFRYKSFSINTGFAMILGAKTRLANPYANFINGFTLPNAESNINRLLLNRWKAPGDELTTNIPSLNAQNTQVITLPNGFISPSKLVDLWATSDAQVVDASFLRSRNIDLSWRLNKRVIDRLKFKSLTITASANNLFVIASKRFNGMDPELKNSVMPKAFSLGFSIGI